VAAAVAVVDVVVAVVVRVDGVIVAVAVMGVEEEDIGEDVELLASTTRVLQQ
jgi:hypothetical protein